MIIPFPGAAQQPRFWQEQYPRLFFFFCPCSFSPVRCILSPYQTERPLRAAERTGVNGTVHAKQHPDSVEMDTIELHIVLEPSNATLYGSPVIPYKFKKNDTKDDKSVIYWSAEQMPQFHGGDEAMYKYISHHIRYPNIAIENDVEGTVNVEFFVEEDGSITQVKALEPSPASGKSNIVVTSYRQERSETSSTDKEKGIRALQEYSEELIRGPCKKIGTNGND